MRAVEGHRENHLLVNRVANVESIKMFVFVHVEFSPNDLLRTCQAPCSCLIPPLDTSAAGGLSVQVLLKSYGKERGFDVKEAFSHVIFYYGQCSIPKPFSLTGSELDEHFGWPVREAVEEVNRHFQSRLFLILSGAH